MSLAKRLRRNKSKDSPVGDGDKSTTFPGKNGKGDGSLYYTGFGGGWQLSPNTTSAASGSSEGGKCAKFCSDPLKLALLIGTLALLISLLATIMTVTIISGRIDRLQEYPSTYGITNVNETYEPGIKNTNICIL